MELAFSLLKLGELDLSISLHSTQPVPQPEWDRVLSRLRQLYGSGQLEPARMRMLVVTAGGAPDAFQRAQLNELWRGKLIKLGLIVPGTSDSAKRGVVTALTWINPAVGVFTPDLFLRALTHLDLQRELASIWSELCRLQQQLVPNRTLQLVAEHAALALPARRAQ